MIPRVVSGLVRTPADRLAHWVACLALGWGLGVGGGCATIGAGTIVEARDLPESGDRPRIQAVDDLAGSDIPAVGAVRPRGAGDGVAVIGETLWIHGANFGRQPTVSIGGHAAAVISRSEDGGILVRVPVRTPAGPQPIVVGNEHGQGDKTIAIRRLVGLLGGEQVAWLDLRPEGPVLFGETAIPGARHFDLSADGRAAYVVDDRGMLHTIELPAARAPEVIGHLDLGAPPVRALLSASTAHRVVAVREQDLVLLDTSAPLRPVLVGSIKLPAWLRDGQPVSTALSPDGEWLAVAIGEKNRLAVLSLADAKTAADGPSGEVALLPNVLAPVLVDLAFSPDGHTLWAISGANRASRSLGPQPTTVHAVRVLPAANGRLKLEPARAVVLEEATGPVALSAGRSLPLASGSAIRLPPEKATVYVSARVRSGDRPVVYGVGAEDVPTTLLTEDADSTLGRTDVSPDGRWIIGALVDGSGAVRFTSGPADGRPGAARAMTTTKANVINEGPPAKGTKKDPAPNQAEVRVQP